MVIIANAKWHIYVMQQTKKLRQWVYSHHSKWTKYQNEFLPYANTFNQWNLSVSKGGGGASITSHFMFSSIHTCFASNMKSMLDFLTFSGILIAYNKKNNPEKSRIKTVIYRPLFKYGSPHGVSIFCNSSCSSYASMLYTSRCHIVHFWPILHTWCSGHDNLKKKHWCLSPG